VKASFYKPELTASLAELEKCVLQHTPSSRLAAAPSAQLDIDLAALLTSARAVSARTAAAIEDPARPADDGRDQGVPSQSTIDFFLKMALRASAALSESASSWPHRWIYAATAILIVVGSLVEGSDYLAGDRVALQASPDLRISDPLEKMMAQVPAAAQTPDAERTTSGSAEQTASTAAPGGEAWALASGAPSAGLRVGASAAQLAQAAATTPTAPVAQPPTTKAVASVGPSAATSSKLQTPVAETIKPVKKPKKASADKSQTREPRTERHAKSKPARVAKPRGAPGAAGPHNVNAEPAVISDARRVTQTITGVLNGLVGVDPHALR